MAFAAPEAQIGRLYEGLKFEIKEGSRTVAHGTILKVFRKDLIKA
jgi:translation elongation factor EF-Tu-like GTPase